VAAEVTSCPGCDAPVAPDQRYCLSCGGQVGERRLDPLVLRARRGTAPELPEAAASPGGARSAWGPRTLGASCLGLLLGGALMGAAFVPGPAGSLAAAAGQVIVVTAPAGSGTSADGGAGGPTAAFAPSEAPVPAPAAPAPAPAPAPVVPAAAPPAPAPPPEPPAPAPEPPAPAKPSVGHVYVVVVPGGPGAEAAYAPEAPPSYLRDELLPKGQLLTGFKNASEDPAINRIGLISGRDTNEEFAPDVKTLADELSTWGFEWRAYVEGMEAPCRHPDPLDPFVSFHSITDRADCAQYVLPLDQFDPKPMLSFIAPLSGDQLQSVVDPILESKPYKKDGLLVLMFDNAPQALVLSPFVEAGSTNDQPYDGYSVLKTIEDRIGLGEHVGHADDKKVHAFGKDVFDRELDPYQDPEGL
jgi:hypothetical protein